MRYAVPALALIALALAAYGNALHSDFIGDDQFQIVGAAEEFRAGLAATLQGRLGDRPILVTSLWANYRLGELSVVGYKLVNITLHAFCALALYALLLRLGRPSNWRERLCAVLVAAAYLAHPVHNLAINQVIQRGVLLGTLFSSWSLVAFIDHLDSGRRRDLLVSLLLFLLGILSKPNVSFVPFVFMFYGRFVRGIPVRALAGKLLPFLVLLAIPPLFYFALGQNRQFSAMPWYDYLSVQLRVVFTYFRLFFYPSGLRYLYEVDRDPSLLHNLTWLALLGHAAILTAAWRLGRISREASFLVFAGYLALIPESSVFPIMHVIFEHRTHFPFLFFAAATYFAARPLIARKPAVLAFFALATIAGTSATSTRSREISTQIDFIHDTLRHTRNDFGFNVYAIESFIKASKPEEARDLVAELRTRAGDQVEYRLYELMLGYGSMPHSQQIEALEEMSARLREPRTLLGATRIRGDLFVIERVFATLDRFQALRLSESLLRPQVWSLGQFAGMQAFAEMIQRYLSFVAELKPLLIARERQGRADYEERLQLLAIEAAEQIHFGKGTDDLSARFQWFIAEDPKPPRARRLFEWYDLHRKRAAGQGNGPVGPSIIGAPPVAPAEHTSR